jgi:hypothetical protein
VTSPRAATPAVSPSAAIAPPVVGDGTTARDRAGQRWRRARGWVVVLGVFVVGGLLALLPAPRQSTTPLAPDNAGTNGARAAAQILGRQGVEVVYVRTAAQAARAAAQDATLLLAGDFALTEQGADTIAAAPGDLVLVGATSWLSRLAPGVGTGFGSSSSGTRDAACDDEDAVAAGRVAASGSLVAQADGVTVCFPGPDGAGYAVTTDGGRRVAVLADATPLTNAHLADEGNAALVLRALGRHDRLVWYVPSSTDTGAADAAPSTGAFLPPWARVLGLEAVLVVLVVALWRGRRLGPVLAERLPVVVPAAETTRGLGRLYRRSRSYGHAAAALRAGTATRLATRLGLPRSADAAATIDAVARASGRPAPEVAALLYGPPPTDDRSLAALADELDHLESEVHRP